MNPVPSLARNTGQELKRRTGQQHATSELARQALIGGELSELLNATVQRIARTLEVEFCYVGEQARESESLLVRAEYGYQPPADVQKRIPAGLHSQGGYTLLVRSPVVVEDLRTETRFQPSSLLIAEGIRSGLSVVIGGRTQAYGVLVVQSREPRRFTDDDAVFLSAVADILSAAIERRRVEDSLREGEERYHALLRISSQILWTTAADGAVIDMPEWGAFTGQTTQEMSGFGWLNALHPDDRAHSAAAWRQAVDTKSVYRTEYRIRKRDGTYEHFTAQGVPLLNADGSVRGWVGANSNITAAKEAEETLRHAKEEAERANRAKNEFLSRISHELRTPLNAILGFGQLLEISPLTDQESESVGHILRAGRHLLGLINEVLSISSIEAGVIPISLEPVEVSGITQECLQLVSRMAAARGLHCEDTSLAPGGPGCYVQADRQRLRQVLLNLLSNAVNYNREGGAITVSHRVVSGDGRQPTTVRLEVRDTGPGLTADEIRRLFMPFERLGAAGVNPEGTGLGLVLSKGLVEAMGGTIGVTSVPGEGSTFWVELLQATDDACQCEQRFASADLPSLDPRCRGVVLCIEDHPSNLRLIERIIETRSSLELLGAKDGREGLKLALEHRPDLILLDLHLPDLDGAEVLARLRADERTHDIPVVVVSADATADRMTNLMGAGASGYLTKPFEVSRFAELLDSHLLVRRAPPSTAHHPAFTTV